MELHWKVFIISVIVLFVLGFIGSLYTSDSVGSEWYQQVKPKITPPNYLFPIVWSVIYILIALSFTLFLGSSNRKDNKLIISFYIVNILFNFLWTPIYFGLRNPTLAFLDLLLIWTSIIYLINFTWKVNKPASWLLVPYFVWVAFAGILNYLSIS